MPKAIQAKAITRTFTTKNVSTKVLYGISLDVECGEFVSIIGRSGAGKSTLLYQLSLLDTPTEGTVWINGEDTSKLTAHQKTKRRLSSLGYIFQDYALVPELTAVENVVVPLLMLGDTKKEAHKKASKALKDVGLNERLNNLPSQLSGGEQQRVSIARSIANEPSILFADEPTASLDSATSQVVIDILKKLNKKGQTIVMITHEDIYSSQTDRIIEIEDGLIKRDRKVTKRVSKALRKKSKKKAHKAK